MITFLKKPYQKKLHMRNTLERLSKNIRSPICNICLTYTLLKKSHWAYQLQKRDKWFTFLLELSEHDEILDYGQNHYKNE